MGFDYETGKFTATQHQLLPAQMLSTVIGLEPSQVGYVNCRDVVSAEDGNTWLKARGRVYGLNEVIRVGFQEGNTSFARVICLDDGLVVDRSHDEIKVWDDNNKIRPINSALVRECPHDYIKVMHQIFNGEEWELVLPAIRKQHGIRLEVKSMAPIIEEIKRLLAEAKSEEYAADDDEEAA